MPRGLYRFHHSHSLHFITFACYHRQPRLADSDVRNLIVTALERTRVLYGMRVYGFVVMPGSCLTMMGGREFDFPQGLKPNVYDAPSGTAEEAAEKKRKSRSPRGLKPARDDNNKGLSGTTEVVP